MRSTLKIVVLLGLLTLLFNSTVYANDEFTKINLDDKISIELPSTWVPDGQKHKNTVRGSLEKLSKEIEIGTWMLENDYLSLRTPEKDARILIGISHEKTINSAQLKNISNTQLKSLNTEYKQSTTEAYKKIGISLLEWGKVKVTNFEDLSSLNYQNLRTTGLDSIDQMSVNHNFYLDDRVLTINFSYFTTQSKRFEKVLNHILNSISVKIDYSKIVSLAEIAGMFVENSKEGELFIVSGTAKNISNSPVSNIELLGKLYNKQGISIDEQAAFCGNKITEEELKNLNFTEIHKRMTNTENSMIKPGEKVSFSIVFNSLDKSMNEFTVNVLQLKDEI